MGDSVSTAPITVNMVQAASPWKRIRLAAEYTGLPVKRLRQLAQDGEIDGYQDPADKRGPKGDGAWWINVDSVDRWHAKRAGVEDIDSKVMELMAG